MSWFISAFSRAFLYVVYAVLGTIAGGLFGIPVVGFFVSIACVALGNIGFERRPPLGPVGRVFDRMAKAVGLPGYDDELQHSGSIASTVFLSMVIYAALGALVALALGFPAAVGAALAAGITFFVASRAVVDQSTTADEPSPDHHNVHGEAEFTSGLDDLRAAGLTIGGTGGFFLGTWTTETTTTFKQRFRPAETKLQRELHYLRFDQETGLLLCAAPGTGKGICFVLTTLLSNLRDTFVCLDPAGQNYRVAAGWLRRSGVKVHCFSPAGMPDVEGTPASCNPLGEVDIDAPGAELEITEQTAIHCPVRRGEKNPFFSGEAQNLIAKVAIFLRETVGPSACWPAVADVFYKSPFELNEFFGRMLRKSRFPSVRSTGAAWYVEIVDGKARNTLTDGLRDVLATARKELAYLLTSGIREMLSCASCNFSNGKQVRSAYFVCMPGDSEAMQKCAHLILATAKRQLCVPGGLYSLWLLDEAAASLPQAASIMVRELLNMARKFRIRIALVCQSYPQYLGWSGNEHEAHSLRAAMGASIFYGANDPETIAEIQREAGNYTTWNPNTSPLAGVGIGGGTGPIGVPLLTAETLREMQRNGLQVAFLAGSRKVAILPRTPYLAIPELQARAAADVFHPH